MDLRRAPLALPVVFATGCLFPIKQQAAEPEPTPEERAAAQAERERKAKQERDDLLIARINAAPQTPNPVATPLAGKPKAVWAGRGEGYHGNGGPLQEAELVSYEGDTLCVVLHSGYDGSSDQPPRYDEDIHEHYVLYAPTAMAPFAGTTSIKAARVRMTDFDARFAQSTYEPMPDGSTIKRDHYNTDEYTEVCWEQASRVLTPDSKYALLDFVKDDGSSGFAYAWRF
jgi:hypothetical protein